jgi:serine phosphatase RsbU (regulator of sigma subunit)
MYSYRIKKRANRNLHQKNEEVLQQKEEILIQNENLIAQKEVIEKYNLNFKESLNYARKIQKAIFPSTNLLEESNLDYFIFNLPKHIVSGDFYFIKKIEDQLIIAIADSTGHGVPGAFMSILGVSFLNDIITVKKILQPNQVLEELRIMVKLSLGQTGKIGENKDGIDIAFLKLNVITLECDYSGANIPLWFFREDAGTFVFTEIKPDKMPIGIHPKDDIKFVNNKFSFQKNDIIFLFSDGFESQFGGEKNEKYKSHRMKSLLTSICKNDLNTQKDLIINEFELWKGTKDQTDDVLVFGLKI